MVIRKIILQLCDISIKVILKFRKIFALTKKDISAPDILVRTIFPYDVVVTKDLFQSFNEGSSTYCEPGDIYTYGVVIGYNNLDIDGNPDMVQVAYFNTAEYAVPEIKMHKVEDLVVNYSPLRSAIINKNIVDMYSQLEGGLQQGETGTKKHATLLGDDDDTDDGSGEIFH